MMISPVSNSDLRPLKGIPVFDYMLLALCLVVLACRVTIPEGITSVLYAGKNIFAAVTYNAVLSAMLIFSALAWFAVNLFHRRLTYHLSGIEFGLVLFALAGLLAIHVASNKRLAIADFVMLTGTLLMAVLLVQLLSSPARIKLVLYVITALGVMQAYECSDQFFASNQITIEQYEKDPNAMLARVGISPGSYRHMLLEHQLYSKDVRGFFTTGNSAGSFALLALGAATILLLEKARNLKANREDLTVLIIRAFLTAFIAFGLLLTHSKGAIAAVIIAAMIFVVHRLVAGRPKKSYAIIVMTAAFMLFAAGVCLIIWSGLTHGRLPGGNSMLVRWQYWTGAARLYADRPLTGVGGANFTEFYPHYKIAAAPETIKDPHNFILSLLTQYGPLGLLGFLAAFFIPLRRIILARERPTTTKAPYVSQQTRNFAPAFLLVIAPVLLIVRPIMLPNDLGDDIMVMLCVISFMFVIPVAIFSIAFLLVSLKQSQTGPDATGKAVLCCVLIGVLLHNCVDFAIFEPGVLTAFWAVAACLIAADSLDTQRGPKLIRIAFPLKIPALILIIALVWACLSYAVIPVVRSTAKIRQAERELETAAEQAGTGLLSTSVVMDTAFRNAHNFLRTAAQYDPYSPEPCSLDARIYLQQFSWQLVPSEVEKVDGSQLKLLSRAEQRTLAAISRNRADFKNFQNLTEIYRILAAYSNDTVKQTWLQKAYDSAREALERFPGNGRLRIELAQLAEQLGETTIAIEQYKMAIQIEDAYRLQFRQMYPGRKIFSRLGEGTYQWVRKRARDLQASPGLE
jgi:hypothetical protein